MEIYGAEFDLHLAKKGMKGAIESLRELLRIRQMLVAIAI